MAYCPIVRKNDQPTDTMDRQQLPAFYMEDFSILGFRVNDCSQAVQVLDRHAFVVRQEKGSAAVDIETAARMQAVMQLLEDSGLECEIADVAAGMYQG